MIDSINGASSSFSNQRLQTLTHTNSLRDTQTLTAVQQSAQKASGAQQPMAIFAVSQTDKSTAGANLPRGSLVDVLV